MRFLSARLYAIGMLVIVFAFALGLAPKAAAQAEVAAGQVVGTSYDATGAVVPQAKVTLDSKATGFHRETVTNNEGAYAFFPVPIGMYVVAFSKTGFKTYRAEVEVTIGAAATVNAKLEVGEVTQVVEVTASALIESTQAQPDWLIGVRSIEELPINGRRFQDFATLTPSTQIEPQRSQISFVGQRGINSNITIDGADYTEPFFGGLRGGERSNNMFSIPQEAISQFQVVTYGYSVEFGRSTGGILNATTKSGTNGFHGSGFLFARNSALAWTDAFGREAISDLYQSGGSVGGPIKKDKIFFFSAFEYQKNTVPHVVIFHKLDGFTPTSLPSGCGENTTGKKLCGGAFNFFQTLDSNQQGLPFTQTNNGPSGFGRLDFQLTQNHRIGLMYHYSRNTGENAAATGDAVSPETTRALSNNGTEGDQTNNGTAQWTAIFSPHLVMEARGTYTLEGRPRLSNSAIPNVQSTIGTFGSRDFLPTTLDDYRLQVSDSLTWTHGTHAVKLGGEFDRLHFNQFFQFNQFGTFVLQGTNVPLQLQVLTTCTDEPSQPCPTSGQNRFDDPIAFYKLNIGNGLTEAALKQIAFFVQDTWRLTPRFTLTAGFRWEGYVNPEPGANNTSLVNRVKNVAFPLGFTVDPTFIPNNYRQYMPRVGIAWDPAGNAKTVIRASAGFFYAPTPMLLFSTPLNNFRLPGGDVTVQLPLGNFSACPAGVTPLYATDKCNTVYSQLLHGGIDLNTFTLDKLPILTTAQLTAVGQALFPGGAPDPFKGVQTISLANNYESPRSWQWSVGMEREIRRGWSVGADFVYINTIHLERNRNLNLPPPVTCTALGPVAGTNATCNVVDLSLRPCFGVVGGAICSQPRPVPSLSDITVRNTDARALYRGFNVRTNYRRSRLQFQASYTLSYTYSNDDNERLAGGFDHDNEFNLVPEYNFSRLDARHQFGTNAVVDLPLGFTVSALGKFRSGHPMEPLTGTDTFICSPSGPRTAAACLAAGGTITSEGNGDNTFFPDRAFQATGVTFLRNAFRDQRQYTVDLRLAKKFKLPREGMSLNFTADFLNVFNFADIQFIGSTPDPRVPTDVYGPGINTAGAVVPANSGFQLLKSPSNCGNNPAKGLNPSCFNTFTTPGSPLTIQLGARFDF